MLLKLAMQTGKNRDTLAGQVEELAKKAFDWAHLTLRTLRNERVEEVNKEHGKVCS
jgi:hypothetical protein